MQTNFLEALAASSLTSTVIETQAGTTLDLLIGTTDGELSATLQASSDGATFNAYGGDVFLRPGAAGLFSGFASIKTSGSFRLTQSPIVAVKVELSSPNGGVVYVGSEVK